MASLSAMAEESPEARASTQLCSQESCPTHILPDEMLLHIFSYLNLRDIHPASSTNRRWHELMEDNGLWKIYAERAHLLSPSRSVHTQDYKALIKEHCTPSLLPLRSSDETREVLAFGINVDGSVIVGRTSDRAYHDNYRAFRWTPEAGPISLGTLNNGYSSVAYATTADGSVVVGYALDGAEENKMKAFRWTAATGMVSLGALNGSKEGYAFARALSADGTVVVGYSPDGAQRNKFRAFQWKAETGMVSLSTLEGGKECNAFATNADGSILVGQSGYNNHKNRKIACCWDTEGEASSLGTLNAGERSCAWAISADGSVIVGESQDGAQENADRAFRWTAPEGMVSLGTLTGGTDSRARSTAQAVNHDGTVIGGQSSIGTPEGRLVAFRWTRAKGMESLEDYFNQRKLLPTNCTLTMVTAMTASGTVMVIQGKDHINERANNASWRAVVPRGDLF
ncbi:HAF repeat-containing protein [Candidatus Odyssella thessalonicensis]|uniref:HAF repeat-containing protein n=1 Tax=Candidatus Odyssella thessalonicensis TaxID=84647 RepID=UPI000225B45D|nr:HAF repeat-containing protein [Candidatus Odyssella thessalonicensis]